MRKTVSNYSRIQVLFLFIRTFLVGRFWGQQPYKNSKCLTVRGEFWFSGPLAILNWGPFRKAEVGVVTFSDYHSTPVPKFLDPDSASGPKNFQIWEPDSCSDSGYHRCNRNSAVFLPKKCHIWKSYRLLLLKMKSNSSSESSFSQFFDSGAGSWRIRLQHSGSVATSGAEPSGKLKGWVIGFVFAITSRSASALAVAFFRLLEPLSYVGYASTFWS